MPSVRSVALGLWIRTGSRNETREQAGLSHFLEHLLFKGTDRFSSTEIDEIFDGMGAEVNAGTGKETTSLYSRFLDQHTERAFDVMADMVLRPSYPDIDSERQVVIEEIAMYEDEPSDKVHDVLAEALFGDHPARAARDRQGGDHLLGARPGHRRLPRRALRRREPRGLRRREPRPRRAGGARGEEVRARLRRRHGARAGGSAARAAPLLPPEGDRAVPPRVGAPGIARGDERRYALRVLDTILGGSTSSRLFQEVREKRGLAYCVFSYSGQYRDAGHVGRLRGHPPRQRRRGDEGDRP